MLLAPDTATPSDMGEVFCVATDDVLHFSQSRAAGIRRMTRLDRAFEQHGIEKHCKKDVNGDLNGTCLGVALTDGTKLSPAGVSLGHLLTC